MSHEVRLPSTILFEFTEFPANSQAQTDQAASCKLFQVPVRSPDICTLPAVFVVAYGTLAEFPILTQADALQR